jgi:hypothetical protein
VVVAAEAVAILVFSEFVLLGLDDLLAGLVQDFDQDFLLFVLLLLVAFLVLQDVRQQV